MGELGFHIFVLFHFGKVLLELEEDLMELLFVSVLVKVKFDDSALEDVDQVSDKAVVGLLLASGRKP